MANYCNNFMSISRRDGGSLTDEEIGAFIRKEDSPEHQGTECKINGEKYYFSYQFVVPVKQDDNWWDNNINNWGVKRDGAYDAYVKLSDNEMTISFDTPRSPPDKWLKAVCKKFPELHIELEYDEPLMGFQGEMGRNEKGELFDNYREGDAYLEYCDDCGIRQDEANISYREDIDCLLCDSCYNIYLNNKKKGGKK